ncbi:reverse transcriptase domain-containing protein [uncultured Alistipes sp.]|jgi:hypothetical protein|uniref:RNA-directed DNA polymerase n=1 Tax=uncultured Alistipes sp. TaxID=538949 RepID=UPI0025CCFA28|nr:reverse transcriptase domain-containing protein [uncultured Alistipes sp.]
MKNKADRELVSDLFTAYFDARKNKRNTYNQLGFEIDFEHLLFDLASEIQNRAYTIGSSICFIVNNPVKREIFAADFRDRVVHHLIYNRINDIFERKLIRDCYSCRKGLGTSDGIERIESHMRSVTDNFRHQAYVLKLDIQSYFMSINRQVLWNIVMKTLERDRDRIRRFDETRYLIRLVIFNDPAENCRVRGNMNEWDGLPPSKSLFSSPPGCGLPIGNLTSQMFSNIYLCDFDNYVKRELKLKYYGRYVDDFYFMHRDKAVLLETRDRVTAYLKDNYGLTVHPLKIYLQDVKHGVTFLGAHVKPHRRYVRNRSLATIRRNVKLADSMLRNCGRQAPDNKTLGLFLSQYNSHLGYLSQFKTHTIRKEMWDGSKGYKRYFYIDGPLKKIKLKAKYRPSLPDNTGPATDPDFFPDFLSHP